MKSGNFKKIAYAFVAVFLLCNFLSFSPEIHENPLYSGEPQQEVSLSVPHGIQFEITTEKNTSTQINESIRLNTSNHAINNLRVILILAVLLCLINLYFINGVDAKSVNATFSQSYILSFIQCKDGKKRS